MIPDDVGKQLHDRATRGEKLSDAEQSSLDAWYAEKDREEAALFARTRSANGPRCVAMSNKELVLETLRKLPEEVSLEEISEEIAILAAIRRGEQAADEGKVVPHEEVKKRLASWKNTK
jgi:hypothetical protein